MRTFDADLIKSVLLHPAIYPRISEDGVETFDPPIDDNHIYIFEPGCLFVAHWVNAVCMECHFQVIPEYREKAQNFANRVLDWFWANTDCEKLIAQIPLMYGDVVGFALKNGFVVEGINRKSYLKNGILHDQYYLGLLRAE